MSEHRRTNKRRGGSHERVRANVGLLDQLQRSSTRVLEHACARKLGASHETVSPPSHAQEPRIRLQNREWHVPFRDLPPLEPEIDELLPARELHPRGERVHAPFARRWRTIALVLAPVVKHVR